jgi:hypothetical protein
VPGAWVRRAGPVWWCRVEVLAGCVVAAGCYGGAAARVARVLRRRLRVLGGRPAAARLSLSAWRVSQAVRMRWLRMACRQAIHRVSGASPVRRHQPRAMLLLAGSLMVEKVRSALVRRA